MKEIPLSQAKPVQYPRKWGVNECPHLKTEETGKSPEKNYIHLPLQTSGYPAESR